MMIYHPLPPNTELSSTQFIAEMNRAIRSLPEFRTGMLVCFDSNGYWLEIFGVKNNHNDDLLSVALSLVLNNSSY